MARTERNWHLKFIEYQNMIIAHKNYKGLPITQKADGTYNWVITTPSDIGNQRKAWAEERAKQLGFKIGAGVYADVMREIHPTKKHVCQTCGSEMSIFYYYSNANFVKAVNKAFGIQISETEHIIEVWDKLIAKGVKQIDLIRFFQNKFGIDEKLNDKNAIVESCEFECRKNGKKLLGPGVMSNFPDRFDGFHTYNRCCRSSQDTGRSKENLKSYTKDRRAYELWSDGNIHAANQFMGSSFFVGISADHIGPISLGFVHDPRYLRPMTSSDNSTKRDRLTIEDVEEILRVETKTKVYPMTWYSKELWEYIKKNYKNNLGKVGKEYRNMLKQNFTNFMFILNCIIENNGSEFLVETLLKPHYEDFLHDYEFNTLGEITATTERRFTERSKYEFDRYVRIAFQSVADYNEKENRHYAPILNKTELDCINKIIGFINQNKDKQAFLLLKDLMVTLQQILIKQC